MTSTGKSFNFYLMFHFNKLQPFSLCNWTLKRSKNHHENILTRTIRVYLSGIEIVQYLSFTDLSYNVIKEVSSFLFVCLFDWLIGWLAGWLFDWLVIFNPDTHYISERKSQHTHKIYNTAFP